MSDICIKGQNSFGVNLTKFFTQDSPIKNLVESLIFGLLFPGGNKCESVYFECREFLKISTLKNEIIVFLKKYNEGVSEKLFQQISIFDMNSTPPLNSTRESTPSTEKYTQESKREYTNNGILSYSSFITTVKGREDTQTYLNLNVYFLYSLQKASKKTTFHSFEKYILFTLIVNVASGKKIITLRSGVYSPDKNYTPVIDDPFFYRECLKYKKIFSRDLFLKDEEENEKNI